MTDLPSSYTGLFGPIDHTEGNEARSVLSPAAYLVDLLELMDNTASEGPDFHAHRPDVRQILLDQANTFSEIPYLDIANEVTGSLQIDGRRADGSLAGSIFPPPLPFSEQHFRLALYARKLGTSLEEIQRLYRSRADAHVSARLVLGLSEEEHALFSTAHDSDAKLTKLWGLEDLKSFDRSNVEQIEKKLGLSLKDLKQLVRQDLLDSELDAAASFFINQGSSDYVVLDESAPAPRLALKNGSRLTNRHLDRMMRFVRLARRLDLQMPDLDWLLQTACGNELDEDALQSIAIAAGIRKATGWPIDEICALWSVPRRHGRGDGPVPADLFDRTYNNNFPVTLAALVERLATQPGATADALDDRLQATLRLSGADFAFLKAALLARGLVRPALAYDAVVDYFSAFRRIVALSAMLSLSVQEVVTLLDVLGAQRTAPGHEDLAVRMPFSAAPTSTPLAVLLRPDLPPRSTLDGLQALIRVKEWLDLRQLSVRQLAFICLEARPGAPGGSEDGSPIDGVLTDDEIETGLGDLYQSLRDAMLAPSALQTGSLTANGARAVFDFLREAQVLVSFDDPARALLRVQPSGEELEAAMQRGVHERLEVRASDFGTLGIADSAPLFSLLVSDGYLERREETAGGEPEVHHFIAPGLASCFSDPGGAATFALPGFQEHAEAVFSVLAAKTEAFRRAGVNLQAEAREVGERLSALSDQQLRAWLRSLSGLLGLSEDLTELAFAWAFGTPDETMTQTMAMLALPLFRAKERTEPALADAYLASRLRRLQQCALLLRKTEMSADQARVHLENHLARRRLFESLELPEDFLSSGKIDALTTLPNGDPLVVSGSKYAAFSRQDYRLIGTGPLDEIPGVALPGAFRARVLKDGLDAAFSDTGADGRPVLHLCAGDQYVTASEAGVSPVKPISDWGKVRNNIRQGQRVDAAVQDEAGRLFLFSGDQYFRYGDPHKLLAGDAFVDERYPRSIRGSWDEEGVAPLPAPMFSKVDAAFRDADGTYYFFSENRFAHSTDPYDLVEIRRAWGHVLNHLADECRVDAAFVAGDRTYLTRRDQLVRYTGSSYRRVDEGYPISFGDIAGGEPLLRVLRRFPAGLDAALAGRDGVLYAFKDGAWASSAAPDTSLAIRGHWGRVRNAFTDNQRVDAALALGGAVYLFCGDQYVRYSGPSYQEVDEGYPRRVRPNWNALEKIGLIPEGLPLPITAVAVGPAPGGASDDVYFFGGGQYAGPGGALGEVKAHWARVRNNIERTGVVDAAMLDGNGRMYLFSGDQLYRYSSSGQEFADETYPRRLSGNWALEGDGYSLPDELAGGISAALRTDDERIFFFSGQRYARVDAPSAEPPRSSREDWGRVRNSIQARNEVSAAFVDPAGRTYLFGGDQFVRYSGASYDFVDEGYPLAIGRRWGDLPERFRSGIDAALSFKSPADDVQRLYLFKGDSYVRYSASDYARVDKGYPKRLSDGVKAEGAWFKGLALHEPSRGPPQAAPKPARGKSRSSRADPPAAANDPIASLQAACVDASGGAPRLFVFYRHEGGVQWRREYRNGRWLAPARVETLDEDLPFTRVDAAFVAPDGTLHVFSEGQHASRPPGGGPSSAPAPIGSRWARVQNQLAELGRVDACLSMGDGRTYLFCARQYVKYTGRLRPGDADFFVEEGYPRRIDPNWPGEGVPLALAPEFQAAGYALCRDASGKIHSFNGERYASSAKADGGTPLRSRWGKVKNRFEELGRVDGAYRADNGNLYLFCDTQYTRYRGALQPGSPDFYADEGYPRAIATGWSSEGVAAAMPERWDALGSAVFRDAQRTYVFAGSSFTDAQAGSTAPVVSQWARVRNQMQSQNRVDAGFVLGKGPGAVTLLFSGDQYVRYSGSYEGFVDEGYPKAIARLPEAEGAFAGLPPELHSGVRAAFAGTDGALHAFGPQPATAADPQIHVSSADPGTSRPLNQAWGIVDNKLWNDERVDAALRAEDGKLYLFRGDQYVRYSGADRSHVDGGYPRKIAPSYAEEIGVAALAPFLSRGVDAALAIGGTTFYFAGGKCIGTDRPDVAQPLASRWGRVDNRLEAGRKLDAAFVAPNGKLYLFAGDQYSVYSGAGRELVDEGSPRQLAAGIGRHWPDGFRSDLDAAAVFEGRGYLFKGSRHVRLSDFRLERPDAGYPLDNAGDPAGRPDFELDALPDWWRIKQLFDEHSSQAVTLLGYLDDPAMDRVTGLARATRWPEDEINALLATLSLQPSALLDGRAIVRLARCFERADRMGTTPSKLKSQVWDKVFGPGPHALQAAADFLHGLIKAATSPSEWPGVARSLQDPLASAKRDALVAYLVERLDLQNADELYESLLTDVQMDASSNTSKILEAINSIQLFYHRALMNLEYLPDDARANLKSWWPWMKNYRTWEANRKVFLHPENYIRPELRPEKSPAFEELEQKLLQDDITAATVAEGYERYLEAFNEISSLRIVGGYRYTYKDDSGVVRKAVLMVGVSRAEPPTYYYRMGALTPEETIDWEPWQKIGITIDSDRVQPVYAFNRLFIFWIETKPYNALSFSSSGGHSYSGASVQAKQVKLTVKFSFYNFAKEWVAPQTLQLNPADPADPTAHPVGFSASDAANIQLAAWTVQASDDEMDDYVQLTLQRPSTGCRIGNLTSGLDLVQPNSAWKNDLGAAAATLPAQTGLRSSDASAIVPWGSNVQSEARDWISFDAKGGTFLCRKVNATQFEPGKILGRRFETVSACFRHGSGDVFVFTSQRRHASDTVPQLCYYHYHAGAQAEKEGERWSGPVFVGDPAWPWGRPQGVFQEHPDQRIRNVVVALNDVTCFLLDERSPDCYLTRTPGSAIDQGATELQRGWLALEELFPGAQQLEWSESLFERSLVRAFRSPQHEEEAVLVTSDGNTPPRYGYTILQPWNLQEITSHSGQSFPAWESWDTVFQIDSEGPHRGKRVVFSRGTQLLILDWSSKAWTQGALGALPSRAPGLSAAFNGPDGKLYFFCDTQYAEANPHDLGAANTYSAVGLRWGLPQGVFQDSRRRIRNVVVALDGTTYFVVSDFLGLDGYFTYPSGDFSATELSQGSPTLAQLFPNMQRLTWAESRAADGRSLVRAFKHPEKDEAVLVIRDENASDCRFTTATLHQLCNASASAKDKIPFDRWDHLDTVFNAGSQVAFSSGKELVIFDWALDAWTLGGSLELPDGASGLSAAYVGADGKLHVFCGAQSAEMDPEDLHDSAISPSWGPPDGILKSYPNKRIRNVVVALDDTTYFLLGQRSSRCYFTYPHEGYGAIVEHDAAGLGQGSRTLSELFPNAEWLSWAASTAGGRSLVRAFKHPEKNEAVLVTSAGNASGYGYTTATLHQLCTASAGAEGIPFDSWDHLDAVFQVGSQVVFSSGKELVIFDWSSNAWTKGRSLGELPDGAPGLSAAFKGVDGKLYFFCGSRYAEVNPTDLGAGGAAPLGATFFDVHPRWGRPSLFPWLLTSVNGALFGPDGKLYLFSGPRCLRHERFDPAQLATLVADAAEVRAVSEVWKSPYQDEDLDSSVEEVDAAWESNGVVYLSGHRTGEGQRFTVGYTCQSAPEGPFEPSAHPVKAESSELSADFYAPKLVPNDQYKYRITRLTSHTSEQFSRRLFAGGIPSLLSPETQGLDEYPRFAPLHGSQPAELFVNTLNVTDYPGKDAPPGLDFDSSNGFYYREIFFHIPYLIAQTLKQAQRFDEAKRWYEYVFDPTRTDFWRYAEFLGEPDLEPIADQLAAYRDDPFDPHRIAELRPIAYRKAFVMSYVDNLLEWGDLLFRQYTRESVGEATMLYVLAAGLLGKKPEELGKRAMSPPGPLDYERIHDLETTAPTEELLDLENSVPPVTGGRTSPALQTPNDSIFNPYFYLPENEQFAACWSRVGDRLVKIRNGLDIDGVKRAQPLLAPPVDVMALVQAFASGAGLAQALADFSTPVPHYRFSFMLARARELTGRLAGLGSALLAALEKKDAEELSLLRNTQERSILEVQLQLKQQQVQSARESLVALQEGFKNVQVRESHYARLLAQGLSPHERAQIVGMVTGQTFTQVSNVLAIASSVASYIPQIGSPFAMTYGGEQIGPGIMGMSQAFRALADQASFQSSLAATLGGWQRRAEDWELQRKLATGDRLQIGRQIKAAEIQVEIARQDVQAQLRQIKNNLSVDTFMSSKFTSRQLYQWMAGKLSSVFFQTYNLALQYAKAAQRAMQFELALPESQVQYVGAGYWDNLRKGLLSGERLQLDLDRLEKAYLEANDRRLEITRYVSLARVDPLALTHLKEKGICELDLTEALFDRDFPGHYCRQIKSVALSFPAVVGPYDNFNATLTQLTHRTLLVPDKAALKHLLEGPDPAAGQAGAEPPATVLRVDWRPNQQVALSRGVSDAGLFQLNFQDERYLPFEGTGAVSTWRLEITGAEGRRHRESLSDVILTLQYTALPGGEAFAEVVKGELGKKAEDRACLLNLASDFPDAWHAFLADPGGGLELAVERRRLPGATGKKVTAAYLHYEPPESPAEDLGREAITLNGIALKPGAFKTGLNLPLLEPGQDATQEANRWRLVPGAASAGKFKPANLKNIALVVIYSSTPSF